MLKDRIKQTNDGFRVLAEPDEERELRYGFFTLASPPATIRANRATDYWRPAQSNEKTLPDNMQEAFVRIVELVDDEIVDEATIYLSHSAQKKSMCLTVEPARKYGRNAFLYTVSWCGESGEKIDPSHIFVRQAGQNGDIFPFLTDVIQPRKIVRKESVDQYIFFIPEGASEDAFRPGCSEILRMKYSVTIG